MTWQSTRCLDCARRPYWAETRCRRHLLVADGWRPMRAWTPAGTQYWTNGARRVIFETAWRQYRDASLLTEGEKT